MAIPGGKMIVKIKIDNSDTLAKLGLANQSKTLVGTSDMTAADMIQSLHKAIFRGLGATQKETLLEEFGEFFQLANDEDGKMTKYSLDDKPLEGLQVAPTTLIYLNKDEKKKPDIPLSSSSDSLKHNNSFTLSDISLLSSSPSSSQKEKFEKHKGETDMEFANRRVLLGWANHRLSLSDREAIIDIVSDFSNGIALCHLLEALTDTNIKGVDQDPKENKIKCLENIRLCLKHLNGFCPSFPTISPNDIYDQIYATVMLFMWKLALAFHIEDPVRAFCQIPEEEQVVYKNVMADYINYANRRVKLIPQRCRPQPVFNLSSSFQDGSAILAITASYDPTFLAVIENPDISIDKQLMRAFGRLQTLYEIPPVLAIEDILEIPNPKGIMAYLAYIRSLVDEDECVAGPIGGAQKRMLHVAISKEKEFEAEGGFVVGEEKEVFLTVYEKEKEEEKESKNKREVESELAYYTIFRNVKINQPGDAFLTFDCVDAGCIGRKRQMKIKFAPVSKGEHIFSIFDEVEGSVSPYCFTVITKENAEELKQKKIEDEEDRRKKYRDLEEKREKKEKEAREKRKKDEEKRRGEREEGRAKRKEVGAKVRGSEEVGVGERALEGLVEKITKRKQNLTKGPKLVEDLHICLQILFNFLETLTKFTTAVGEGWGEGEEGGEEGWEKEWLEGVCGGWRGGCCGLEGVWEEVDGVLINDGMVDEEMHLDTSEKFLAIANHFKKILDLLSEGDFEEVKGEIYKIYKIAVFFETDVTYGDGLRTMLQIVADDSAPIPKPPRMAPISLPPPPLSSSALPPPLVPPPLPSAPSSSSLPPPLTPSAPALPPPPSAGGEVKEEKNEVLLLKYLNRLSILSLESSKDEKITLSRCAELSPIIQNVTNCCRLLSSELPNHSPLFLSLPSTLSPAVMGVVRGRKEGKGEKFLEVREVANGVRKRVVGVFKRFRELYEFVGEVCQLGNMIDLFESSFVLLHESNVFTMKDFKIFLSTDDWNAFLLPVKLKRIMAFCFETKIQKEGGIPLIPLNEVNYLPTNITILKILTTLEQLDATLCKASPPPPPPPFPPLPSTPPPPSFSSLVSSPPSPLSFPEWPLEENTCDTSIERLLSIDVSVKNAIRAFSDIFSEFSDSLNRGIVGGELDKENRKERREARDKEREWVEGWLVGGVVRAVWLVVVGEMGVGEGVFVSEREKERKKCAASGFAMVAPSFLFEKEEGGRGEEGAGEKREVWGWGMKKAYLETVYGLVVRWGLLDSFLKGVNDDEEEEEEEGKRKGGRDGERKRRRKREEEKAKRILDVWSGVNGVEGVVERVPREGEKVREVGEKMQMKEEEMMEKLRKGEGEEGGGEEIVLSQAVCMEKVDQIDSCIFSLSKVLKNDADSPQLLEEIEKLYDSYEGFCASIWKVFQGMASAKKRQRLRARFQFFSAHLSLILSAITNPRYHLAKYVNDLQDQYFPIQVALGVTELRAGDYVLIQHSVSKRFLGSSSGQFADVSPVVLTYDIFSHASGGEDLEVKSEWKFDFLPPLPLAPGTHKCLIKNAITEEFFGPDPYFFESNLDDVELCSSLEQKFSSEWNIELWEEGEEEGKKGNKDGKNGKREEGEGGIQRKGALRFVLRNSMTLNYLCVVDKEITWASTPSVGSVFCVVGPGAERIAKRLKKSDKKVVKSEDDEEKNNREFIVEWDFEVENKGEIAVEAGEIVYLEKDKHADWIKIRRKDQKVGYIPRAYAKPYVGRTQGKSISLIVELARDPQNIKELIVDSKISFDGLKESIGHSFGALVSELASVAGSPITSVSQLRPYDRVVVKLGSDNKKGGGDEAWQSESDKKLLADDMIASALLDQRAPSRNWYRNKQKTTNTDEVKGMLRVFLPDDPALDKFGLRSSVFTIRYFGITMRAAHLKAAVKEQMCSKSRIKDELLEYTKRFVIVEVKPDSHRVVSRREPLGKWEKDNCPANTRLMYVPILSHFNFKVNYHASQVKVNTWFHVRLHVTDPIHLDRSVDQMEADLAVWVRNSLGTESEYEMVQDHEKRGCFIAKLRFATAGRYRACIKFDGFAIQSKNTTIHIHTSGFGNKIRRVMRNVPHISSSEKGGKDDKTPELSAHSFFDSPKSEPKDKQKKKTEKKNRKLFG